MSLKDTFGRLLCSIGIHKWGKKFGHDQISSNVIDWKKRCLRCGFTKKWVKKNRKIMERNAENSSEFGSYNSSS